MNQLKIISLKSVQEEARLAWEKARPEQNPKPPMRLCKDGKTRPFASMIKRSREEQLYSFWSRVEEVTGGCWEWTAAKNGSHPLQRYGIVWFDQRKYKCHRFSWEIFNGKIEGGLCVCHKCDNPPCCNPNHLFLGTFRENSMDSIRKGRAHREFGEMRYNSKLKESDVLEIRRRYKSRGGKNSGMSLAKEFGVVRSMINSITKGHRWKHLLSTAG